MRFWPFVKERDGDKIKDPRGGVAKQLKIAEPHDKPVAYKNLYANYLRVDYFTQNANTQDAKNMRLMEFYHAEPRGTYGSAAWPPKTFGAPLLAFVGQNETWLETRKRLAMILGIKDITIRSWRFSYRNGAPISDSDKLYGKVTDCNTELSGEPLAKSKSKEEADSVMVEANNYETEKNFDKSQKDDAVRNSIGCMPIYMLHHQENRSAGFNRNRGLTLK